MTEKPSGYVVEFGDLPSGSTKNVLDPSDYVLPPPKKIRKREREGKLQKKERTTSSSELSMNKKLEQLRENGEAEIRIQRIIKSLNIETTHYKSNEDHKESIDYKDVIQSVDYLDCSGLYFSDVEKQSKSFDPFSQSSVYDFLAWKADCDKVFRKTRSAKCRLILSILFSAYTKEAILELKPRDSTLIIDSCMDYAIQNKNHILVLELVRLYVFHFHFHLQKLFKGKEINSVVKDTLLQTVKYMILRECPGLRQNAISLLLCCECSQESRLVIMMLYKGSIEMKDGIPEKAMGVNLVPYNYTQPSDEASTVFNSFAASGLSKNLPGITEKDARELFKKHSNLTLISASPFKSTGYLKGKHKVVENLCISLLCLHKGFIPFGEEEFPKQINGFEVDVQEGYCSLGSGRSLDFGGHIRRAKGINTPGNGSIGGFVDLPKDPHNPNRDSVGLITCAHVVFSSDELNIPREELKDMLKKGTDFEVEAFDKDHHTFKVCGRIVDKCFPEKCSCSSDSVDAALIKLDQTVNEFRFRPTPPDQLLTAGFDPNTPPAFKGEVVLDDDLFCGRIPGKLDSVVKYGSTTGFTIGSLFFPGSHIRFVDDILGLPDKLNVASMCNQIEIQSLPHGTFFEPGDSGAFVFCINSDKTLSCIGMAIGSSTKGSCLVTPMVRILRSFDLDVKGTLKPCPSYVSGDTTRAAENPENPSTSQLAQQSNASSEFNLGATLLALQTSITNIQTSITSMQTLITNQQKDTQSSLNNLQTEVGNLKTNLQETKDGLQTEIINLRTHVEADVRNLKAEVQEIKDKFQTRSSGSSSDIIKN